MWSPTHVQVTVQRAKNLLVKGRGATNDAFVLIQMGKEKFQTSVKEKIVNPEWYEECDLHFQGRDSVVHLVVFHRNLLGLDEFLGQVYVPLQQFESYDKPVNKWYSLQSKTDKKAEKYRGEIEVRIAFVVRHADTQSLNDFSIEKKKRKNSFKGIATSVGHKIQKMPGRTFSLRPHDFDPRGRLTKLLEKRNSISSSQSNISTNENVEEGDSISICDNEDRHMPLKSIRKLGPLYSSTISLPQSAMITSSIQEIGSLENINNLDDSFVSDHSDSPDLNHGGLSKAWKKDSTNGNLDTKQEKHGEWTKRISSQMKDLTRSEMNLTDVIHENGHLQEKKSTIQSLRNTLRRHTLHLSEAPDFTTLKTALNSKRNSIDSKRSNSISKEVSAVVPEDIPAEVYEEYSKKDHRDLVILAIKQQAEVERQRDKIADLENYLDNLLVRVMETTPKILQMPYKSPYELACSR